MPSLTKHIFKQRPLKTILAMSLTALLSLHTLPVWSKTYDPLFDEPTCQSADCLRLQKDPVRAMALNLIPLGYGSYQQGDTFGGTTISIVDGLSLGSMLVATGFVPACTGWCPQFLVFMGAGILGLGLGRTIGFIAPWAHYADYQNKTVPLAATHQQPDLFSHQRQRNDLSQFTVFNYSTQF